MERDEILARLRRAWPALRDRHGVARLALFGSAARGEAGPGSDVDLLVAFTGEPDYDQYLALKEDLEALLGRPVDLVLESALKPWARPVVETEAIRVA